MSLLGALPLIAALMLSGCALQPLWKPEPEAAKPPPAAPVEQQTQSEPAESTESAPEPSTPPEEAAAPQRAAQVEAGIAAYDDGKYKEAAKLLRAAVHTKTLEAADRVEAYKYLAFIECSANRRSQCRSEFRHALKLDPDLELTPTEAGHPVWGPIFRRLKQLQKRKR